MMAALKGSRELFAEVPECLIVQGTTEAFTRGFFNAGYFVPFHVVVEGALGLHPCF